MEEEKKMFRLIYYYHWRYILGVILFIISISVVFLYFMKLNPLFSMEIMNFAVSLILVFLIFVLITKFMVIRCRMVIGEDKIQLYADKHNTSDILLKTIDYGSLKYYGITYRRGQNLLKIRLLKGGLIVFYLNHDNFHDIRNTLKKYLPEKERN